MTLISRGRRILFSAAYRTSFCFVLVVAGPLYAACEKIPLPTGDTFAYQDFQTLQNYWAENPAKECKIRGLESLADRKFYGGRIDTPAGDEKSKRLVLWLDKYVFDQEISLLGAIGDICAQHETGNCLRLLAGDSEIMRFYRERFKDKKNSDYKPDEKEDSIAADTKSDFLRLYEKLTTDEQMPARIAILVFLAGLPNAPTDSRLKGMIEELEPRIRSLESGHISNSLLAFSGSDFKITDPDFPQELTLIYTKIWQQLVEKYRRNTQHTEAADAVLYQQLPRHISQLASVKPEDRSTQINEALKFSQDALRERFDFSKNELIRRPDHFKSLESLSPELESSWASIGQPQLSSIEVSARCENHQYYEIFFTAGRPDLSRLISPERLYAYVSHCTIGKGVRSPVPSLMQADCRIIHGQLPEGAAITRGWGDDAANLTACYNDLVNAYRELIRNCRSEASHCDTYAALFTETAKPTAFSALAMIDAFYGLKDDAAARVSWIKTNRNNSSHCLNRNDDRDKCTHISDFVSKIVTENNEFERLVKWTINRHVLDILKRRTINSVPSARIIKPYYRSLILAIRDKHMGNDAAIAEIAEMLFQSLEDAINSGSASPQPQIRSDRPNVTAAQGSEHPVAAILELIELTGQVWRDSSSGPASYAFEKKVLEKVRELIVSTRQARQTSPTTPNENPTNQTQREFLHQYLETEGDMDSWMQKVPNPKIRKLYVEGLKAPLSTIPGYFSRPGQAKKYLNLVSAGGEELDSADLKRTAACHLLNTGRWMPAIYGQQTATNASTNYANEVSELADFLLSIKETWLTRRGIRIDCGGHERPKYISLPAVRPIALAGILAKNQEIKEQRFSEVRPQDSLLEAAKMIACLEWQETRQCPRTEAQPALSESANLGREHLLRFTGTEPGADAFDDLVIYAEDIETPPTQISTPDNNSRVTRSQRHSNGLRRAEILSDNIWNCNEIQPMSVRHYYCGIIALFLPDNRTHHSSLTEEIRDQYRDKRMRLRDQIPSKTNGINETTQAPSYDSFRKLKDELTNSLPNSSTANEISSARLNAECSNINDVTQSMLSQLTNNLPGTEDESAKLARIFQGLNSSHVSTLPPAAMQLLENLYHFDAALKNCANNGSTHDKRNWLERYNELYYRAIEFVGASGDPEMDFVFFNIPTAFLTRIEKDPAISTEDRSRVVWRLPLIKLAYWRARLQRQLTPKYIYQQETLLRGQRDFARLQKGKQVTLFGPEIVRKSLEQMGGNLVTMARAEQPVLTPAAPAEDTPGGESNNVADQPRADRTHAQILDDELAKPLMQWILREAGCTNIEAPAPVEGTERPTAQPCVAAERGVQVSRLMAHLAGDCAQDFCKKFAVIFADKKFYARDSESYKRDLPEGVNYLQILAQQQVVLGQTKVSLLMELARGRSSGVGVNTEQSFNGASLGKPKSKFEHDLLREEFRHRRSKAVQDWEQSILRTAEFFEPEEIAVGPKAIYDKWIINTKSVTFLSNNSDYENLFKAAYAPLKRSSSWSAANQIRATIINEDMNKNGYGRFVRENNMNLIDFSSKDTAYALAIKFIFGYYTTSSWNFNSGYMWKIYGKRAKRGKGLGPLPRIIQSSISVNHCSDNDFVSRKLIPNAYQGGGDIAVNWLIKDFGKGASIMNEPIFFKFEAFRFCRSR